MQIDPDLSYPDWFKVACAIHAGTHGDAEGFEMFDMWSSTGKKYKHDAVVTLWRSIRPGKGVNTGTLFANDFPKIREPKFEQKPNENIGGLTWDLGEVQKEETPPTYWFAQDLITIGAHLLIAKAKAGKSLLIVQAAYAHATGGIFLGRECVKTKVLLFAAENTRTEIKQILRRLGLVFPIGMVDLWTMERIEDGTVGGSLNEWIHEYLQARPECKVVILDTMVTAEARWGGGEVDKKSRQAPVTEQAYQRFRVYETTAKANVALIWLLHHAGKQKTKVVIDFHESINMPGTALAAVTASLVLAFAPDYDPLMAGSEEGAAQPRILSIRGRFIPEIVYAGELSSTNGFTLLGKYSDVLLSKTQQDFMRAVEALMSDVTPGPDGTRWTTYQAIADERGVSRQSIPQLVARMKQKGLLKWKDKVLVTKPKLGVTLR
jgi:hypothetical protein